MRTTWKPHEKHGRLTAQSDLPDSVYAFPTLRKEPLTDARHVRARFDQVADASDSERMQAFANIKKAARHYGVDVSEASWRELGKHPQKYRSARAKRAAATRKRRSSATRKSRRQVGQNGRRRPRTGTLRAGAPRTSAPNARRALLR